MTLIPGVDWDAYKELINHAHDLFNKHEITWRRSKGGLDIHNEDFESTRFDNITLEVLIDFNAFRKWPINTGSESGDLDRQIIVILINRDYLRGLGFLNANENFAFKSNEDRFIIQGITYKSWGDTPISQANDEPLLEQLILMREEIDTGKPGN